MNIFQAISINTGLSVLSILTSLTACIAVYHYVRRLPKERALFPWYLMLIGMACLAIYQILDVFAHPGQTSYAIAENVLTILAELAFAFAFIRLFAADFLGDQARQAMLNEPGSADKLSGLGNRRYFDEKLSQEFHFARTRGMPIALAIFDLDHFKTINERFGNQAGDEAIRCIAQLVSSFVRSRDTAARIGGDELGLILPNTALRDAEVVVERIRGKLEETPFVWEGQRYPLTCSVGLTASTPEGYPADELDLFRQADVALYRAKVAGRNQVFVETIPAPVTSDDAASRFN